MIITPRGPQRIVCLTEETTETLYLLGEEHRIVGISGFTVRPRRARLEKPRVSAFTSANIDRILGLNPDLVLAFSDLQADIAAQLARKGVAVHILNHRSVQGILEMISMVGAMVGAGAKADQLIAGLMARIERAQLEAALGPTPVVFFEEWDSPMISAIRWVSELIEIAGGRDCFEELSHQSLGKDRIIADPEQVIARTPDIIIGSWCGKKFRPEQVAARSGWHRIPAVADRMVFEIKSPIILQPGPAALTDGLDAMCDIIRRWRNTLPSPSGARGRG
jgi:iron complex transport system substrate-binding protein